jgi:ABC-2 type transport system permease protein
VTAGAAAPRAPQRGAPLPRQLAAQSRMELRLLARNGEQLLLTVVIPALVLVVFARSSFVTLPRPRVDYVVPGVLALAVLSTAFTGQAIATGFERRYGVLRRLGTTPLPRAVLLAAKTVAVLAVEAGQVLLLTVTGLLLGWSPHGSPATVLALLLLGTAALSAVGLLLAGALRAEATLAAANLVFVAFVFVGGVVVPLHDLPAGLTGVLRWLPVDALADGLRVVLRQGGSPSARDWIALGGWTAAAGGLAARAFRWQ